MGVAGSLTHGPVCTLFVPSGRSEKPASAPLAGVTIAEFFPSLHANLAEVYLRLGDHSLSLKHLAAAVDLPDGPYGALVRRGIDRLAVRVAAA